MRKSFRINQRSDCGMKFSSFFGAKGTKRQPDDDNDSKPGDAAGSYPSQKLEQLTVDISITKRRLEYLLMNLQARDKDLVKRISEAQTIGDEFKVRGLASELLQVRKIANLAFYSSYMLEVVRVRLDTIKFVSAEILPTLRLVKPLLSEVREAIQKVSPGSEITIQEIENNLSDIMARTSTPEAPPIVAPEVTDKEVKKILDDIQRMALDKVSQSFPEVPELDVVVENTVLEYVLAHRDTFDLKIAEKELPLSKNQIMAALKSLDSKGKIHIEYGTAEEEHII